MAKLYKLICMNFYSIWKIASEYDQEIPQSQTADKPMALPYFFGP